MHCLTETFRSYLTLTSPGRRPFMPLPIRQLLGFITYYITFSYYLLLLPLFDPRETHKRFRQRLKKAARISMRMFGVTVKLKGIENLNTETNKIIIANHSSWFDQIALIATLDIPLSFVSNEKYFRYWGLSRVLRKMGSVPVHGRDITKSLKASRETLDADNWLVIYPEGTRSRSLLPFRRGAALLAQQTGVPLQPVLIDGAQEVLPRRKSLLKVRPGVITLTILPSMPKPDTISTRVCMQQIQSCFTNQVSKLNPLRGSQTPEQKKILPNEAAAKVRVQPVPRPRSEATQAAATAPNCNSETASINGPRQLCKAKKPETATEIDTAIEADTTAEEGNQQQYPVDINTLQPSNSLGMFYLLYAILMTLGSISLSLSSNFWLWLTGQLLLAITFIQWFAILHEAGHKTMFRTRWLNRWTCYFAGFFALIPGDCWRLVHAKHHYWTGWQDLDVTTETLVPRQLRGFERITINTCWRLWIPLFASLYRWNNYWNLMRLRQMFQRPRQKRLVTVNILAYLLLYIALATAVGISTLLTAVGLGLLVSFALQDLLILSQHTHIPMKLSAGNAVRPFTPAQQEVFTRSLLFPTWFARLVLLNVDAHGLHHMLPRIPGYHLHQLQTRETLNCIRWWKWILAAKSVPGETLLFQNRDQTGFHF
jgi:1-acyl-sn-glycerol-3-phosphate acyltransferase